MVKTVLNPLHLVTFSITFFNFICSLAGYSTAFTISELNEREIEKLQNFGKGVPTMICNYCKENNIAQSQQSMLCRLFLGLYEDPANFKIFVGEQMLLQRVACWVKSKVSSEDNMKDYLFFQESICGDKRSLTTQTRIGILFGECIEKKRGKNGRTGLTRTAKSIISSNDENFNNTAKDPTVFDVQTMTNFIVESCEMRLKKALKTYMEKCSYEKKIMESCGISDIDELKMDIVIGEKELDRLFNFDNDIAATCYDVQGKAQDSNKNVIKATIKCYCSIKSGSTISIYFRCTRKWVMLKSGKIRFEDAVKELSTAWIPTNFEQHLKTHRKYQTADTTCTATDDESTCKFYFITPHKRCTSKIMSFFPLIFFRVVNHLAANDGNNNVDRSETYSNDSYNLANLSISTQQSIQDCFRDLINTPSKISVAGIYHVLCAFIECVFDFS